MRVNEQGRSMIEMLGVLAIVGVLSVGGIAGYSKAMNKFKTNKAIDQINMLSTNIRTLFSSQGDYSGMDNQVLINAGVIPSEMYKGKASAFKSKYDGLNNAFGGKALIRPANQNGTNDAYIIAVDGIPNSACVVMASTDWGSDVGSGLAGMVIGATTAATGGLGAQITDISTGANLLAASGTVTTATTTSGYFAPGAENANNVTPLTVINAQKACASGTNTFVFKYI